MHGANSADLAVEDKSRNIQTKYSTAGPRARGCMYYIGRCSIVSLRKRVLLNIARVCVASVCSFLFNWAFTHAAFLPAFEAIDEVNRVQVAVCLCVSA